MRAENNFKQQTEIDLIFEEWEVVRLEDERVLNKVGG